MGGPSPCLTTRRNGFGHGFCGCGGGASTTKGLQYLTDDPRRMGRFSGQISSRRLRDHWNGDRIDHLRRDPALHLRLPPLLFKTMVFTAMARPSINAVTRLGSRRSAGALLDGKCGPNLLDKVRMPGGLLPRLQRLARRILQLRPQAQCRLANDLGGGRRRDRDGLNNRYPAGHAAVPASVGAHQRRLRNSPPSTWSVAPVM